MVEGEIVQLRSPRLSNIAVDGCWSSEYKCKIRHWQYTDIAEGFWCIITALVKGKRGMRRRWNFGVLWDRFAWDAGREVFTLPVSIVVHVYPQINIHTGVRKLEVLKIILNIVVVCAFVVGNRTIMKLGVLWRRYKSSENDHLWGINRNFKRCRPCWVGTNRLWCFGDGGSQIVDDVTPLGLNCTAISLVQCLLVSGCVMIVPVCFM